MYFETYEVVTVDDEFIVIVYPDDDCGLAEYLAEAYALRDGDVVRCRLIKSGDDTLNTDPTPDTRAY